MATNFFKVKKGISLDTNNSGSVVSTEGDIAYNSSSHKLEVKDNSATRSMVSEDGTATLTNKTIDASANTLSNVVGTTVSTTATNSTNASFFPTFVASSSSSNQNIDTATGLTFNPSTNTLSTTTFSGALSGNATTATNATNTAITDDTTTNATMFPTWVTTASGNQAQKTSSSKLTFNPSSGTLTTTTVAAALTGTASGNLQATANNHGILVSGSGNTATVIAPNASTVFPLVSGGSSADPGWSALTAGGGGTGQTSYTKGDILVASGSTTLTKLGVGTDGQIPVADSSQTNGLKWATLQQGAKNYITYNNFENNATTGWSLCNSTLSSNFPNAVASSNHAFDSSHGGTAASGNLSIAASSSSPLAGTYSLTYVSSAATTAGDMVISQSYTIDSEDQAKILAFKFFYTPSSNSSNGNWSGTSSNSFGVGIYDLANNAWIMPAGVWNFVQSSGAGICQGTFQTPSNMTGFQIAIFNANASAGAITLKLDDFYVGPQSLAFGAAETDWADISSAFTPNSTPFGTVTNKKVFARRIGDSLRVNGTFQAGTTTANPGSFTITGYSWDLTKINSTATCLQGQWYNLTKSGASSSFANSGSATFGAVFSDGASNSTLWFAGSSKSNLFEKVNINGYITSTDTVTFDFIIPISGWSSNTSMSTDTDTRYVACRATYNGTASFANATVVPFNATDYDTHGAFNTGTNTYTIPISGKYKVTSSFNTSSTASTAVGNLFGLQLFKNGSSDKWLSIYYAPITGSLVKTGSGSVEIDCFAGDTITVKSEATSVNGHTFSGDTSLNWFCIERLSGPAVVATSESVVCKYQNTAGTSITNSLATMPFVTKIYDSHSAFNGSTGVFTAPVSGKYRLFHRLKTQAVNNSTAQLVSSGALVTSTPESLSGAFCDLDIRWGEGVSHARYMTGGGTWQLNAGDTLAIQAQSSNTVSLDTSAQANIITIERVGN